jgi:hypothetical protein
MNTWTSLCQKNVNHHPDHPSSHIIIPIVVVGIVVIGTRVLLNKMHRTEMSQKGITV